jgi:hypothetical protein
MESSHRADLPACACAASSLLRPRHSGSASARWTALSQEPCQRHQVRPRLELCGVRAALTSHALTSAHTVVPFAQDLPQRSSVNRSVQSVRPLHLECRCERPCELAAWDGFPVQARAGTSSWSR